MQSESSEERDALLRRVLGPSLEAFRSRLAATVEQARHLLDGRRLDEGAPASQEQVHLGGFAAGRIDPDRFSALLAVEDEVDDATAARAEQVFHVLKDMADRDLEPPEVRIPSGACFRSAVDRALTDVGRAFGAARVAELIRTGKFEEGEHGILLGPLPFSRWARGERLVAPPLVIRVAGADLQAGALGEFLDGGMKFVVVVEGDCPPAPLACLVSPGTFVLQTVTGTGLERLVAWGGPGIAALVPEGAAGFVHEPDGGTDPWDRFAVHQMPTVSPTKRLGGISPEQQVEQIRLLEALAARPPAAAAAAPPATDAGAAPAATPAADDPVGSIAAWLLGQAAMPEGA